MRTPLRYLSSSALVVALCFLALGAIPDAHAQSGRIVGTVSDANTGESLPGANVVIQGTSKGAATDIEGKYTLPSVSAGTYTLLFSYVGYERVEREVTVGAGETVTVDADLPWEGVEGDEVVITAQAQGQVSAINQQLSSNTISNIVSSDRIQELPDVNAAESIGRLPGISIQRSGGEATKVAIRGLSPKYSTVTVNGVRVPSTGNERDVDLSLISSNMLDGIEVKKAITADMDADATAGSVDLRLKKAPEGLSISVMGQGGYTQLQDEYGNYKFSGTVSNRFLDSRLGIIATFNTDRYDRSADKFSGSYRRITNIEDEAEIVFSSVDLREEVVDRGRSGASFLFDYQIPNGAVTGNAFYNRLTNESLYRINRMSVENNRHYYDVEERENTTSILTASVGLEQDFGWIKYDAAVSRTGSNSENPQDYIWNFSQEGNAFDFEDYQVGPETHPTAVLPYVIADSTDTGIANAYYDETQREENQTGVQLNLQMPFQLGDYIGGYVKTGGKLRWLDRSNDEERIGREGLQYGTTGGDINAFLRCADSVLVNGLNGYDIGDETAQQNWLPIYVFDTGYDREDFLDGDYPLGYTADPALLKELSAALNSSVCQAQDNDFREYVNQSRGNDYSGEERYQAGYVMSEINIGEYVTFIPGIRWEHDWSEYEGQRYREVSLNNSPAPPTDLDTLNITRDFDYWLPMVHLQIDPTEWLKIRLARTETLQRPDFNQYAPISRIDAQQQFAFAGNSQLKPARSTNYDAAISIFQNKVGLFTAAAFHKTVEDHIIWVRFYSSPNRPVLPGLNIPDEWIVNPQTGQPINPKIDTYINNDNAATYKGLEFDWQTNFWYLPSFLRGIVFSANYTRIFSETEYDGFYQERVCIADCDGRRPEYETVTRDTSRIGRMVGQPKHVANVTLGYDIGGFSARLSYLYQDNRVNSIDAQQPVLDQFSGDYSRFDLQLRQKFGGRFDGLEVFANVSNLNNRADRNYQGSPGGSPTYIEYYGRTIDLGARYRF